MSNHRLFQQPETSFHQDSSAVRELSPVRGIRPAASDPLTLVLGRKVKGRSKPPTPPVSHKSARSDSSEPVPGSFPYHDTNSDTDLDSVTYSDSDSDCPGSIGDTSKPKLPYTMEEDEWILEFVLKDKNVFKVCSISLWKRMENKKNDPKRTYQSLKNRFLRNIKPHIFTRYKHLIKDEVTVDRILAKFPELKSTVGRVNTLSRIQLPERKPAHWEDVRVRTGNGASEDGVLAEARDCTQSGSRPSEPANFNSFGLWNFSRKVKIKNESATIKVKFKSKKDLETPIFASQGLYEKYKMLAEKNKLVLCSSCGRKNRPRKNKSLNSRPSVDERDGDVLIANSPDAPERGASTAEHSDKNIRTSSELRKVTEFQKPAPKPSLRGGPASRASDGSSPRGTDAGSGGVVGEIGRAEASGSAGRPAAGGGSKDLDEEFDAAYEDTVSDFRKLISSEEERLLVKKCLIGNRDVLGIDSCLEMSMESYFLEDSPNLETPMVTEDCSAQVGGYKSEREIEHSRSSLARNMMNMLGAELSFQSWVGNIL